MSGELEMQGAGLQCLVKNPVSDHKMISELFCLLTKKNTVPNTTNKSELSSTDTFHNGAVCLCGWNPEIYCLSKNRASQYCCPEN